MTYLPGVTVAIPTIPPRARMLACCLESVGRQTRLPDAVVIAYDLNHEGPAVTRNRAMDMVVTEWTVLIDDDDELLPNHIEATIAFAEDERADVVYSGYEITGPGSPYKPGEKYGPAPFDAGLLQRSNFIPECVTVRTELLHKVDGCPTGASIPKIGSSQCEDWGMHLRLWNAGAKYVPLDELTWRYNRHGGNLSGQTWR